MANIIKNYDNFLNEELDLFGKKKKEKEDKKETNRQLFVELRKILRKNDYNFADMGSVSNTMYAYRANKKQHFCLGPEGKEIIHLEELEFLGDSPEGELITIDLTGNLEAAANKIIKTIEKNYKEFKNESVMNESNNIEENMDLLDKISKNITWNEKDHFFNNDQGKLTFNFNSGDYYCHIDFNKDIRININSDGGKNRKSISLSPNESEYKKALSYIEKIKKSIISKL